MPPPNLLLITSDQQQWHALGVTDPILQTPNLDRLGSRGVRFTRAYCPNPTCTPTRASLLTGQWPSTHGAYTLGTKLAENTPTLPGLLRDRGYHTALVGKAHFQPLASTDDTASVEAYPTLHDRDFWRGFNDTHTPWYGFDHVELTRNHADEGHAGQHYGLWLESRGVTHWRDYFQLRQDGVRETPTDGAAAPPERHGAGYGWRTDMAWKLPAELHYSTWTAERTNAAIDAAADADQPFFVWSSYHDPHPPYCVPEPWASMYDPADMTVGHAVDGELDDMPPPHRMTRDPEADFGVFNQDGFHNHGYHPHTGHTEQKLREAKAVYFGMISFMDQQIGRTLDHLEQRGLLDDTLIIFTSDHGHFIGEHGLVAKGPFHYEELIRVPMLAAGPGLPAGTVNDAPQTLVDLPAVFAGAATGEAPRWMQGVDQRVAWSNGGGRDAVIVENHHQTGDAVHLRTVVTRRHKLTVYRGRPDWGELFDLESDPAERYNLYHREPRLRAELMQAMLQADLAREWCPTPRVASA